MGRASRAPAENDFLHIELKAFHTFAANSKDAIKYPASGLVTRQEG
jgi:hypothetical protein